MLGSCRSIRRGWNLEFQPSHHPRQTPSPERAPDRVEEIERSGLFSVAGIKRYVWAVDYAADFYIDVLNRYSGHIAWPQWKRDRLYAEVRELIGERAEKRIRKHYLSILHICRRIS